MSLVEIAGRTNMAGKDHHDHTRKFHVQTVKSANKGSHKTKKSAKNANKK